MAEALPTEEDDKDKAKLPASLDALSKDISSKPETKEKGEKIAKQLNAIDPEKAKKREEGAKVTNFHYRRIVFDELENDEEIFPCKVFTNIDIMRG